jgi:predicted RNA binding protein YcfA (HicA-like mRNA interferase family)
VTGAEVLAALKRAGWYVDSIEGSHHQMRHTSHRGWVTVPVHAGEILHPKTLKSILRDANMTPDELRALL